MVKSEVDKTHVSDVLELQKHSKKSNVLELHPADRILAIQSDFLRLLVSSDLMILE